MTENKKISETTENTPLTDEQLEKVSGGEDLSLSAMPIIYLKCAVDSRHIWPYGVDACPVCGSTEFIRTVVPEWWLKRRKCLKIQDNAKGANIMNDSRKNKPAELTEDQLSEVSGGETEQPLVHPMAFKRCAANPDHVYVELHDACPICGCKEFTRE